MNRIKKLPIYIKVPVAAIVILLAVAIIAFEIGSPDTELDTSNPVGLLEKSYTDSSRNRQLDAYVWYPTEAAEGVTVHNENAVFHGFSAIADAPITEGVYPLVIMSHGSGGNRGNQAWLGIELARQGAIVVAASHPGSMSMDSAPGTNILAWNRPMDVSFLIDSVLADPDLAAVIDPEQIAVVGHSLGGYTAFAMGGGELSIDQFSAYCTEFSESPACAFYLSGGVDFMQVDRAKFEQNHKDDRVSAVVVLDPAYAKAFKTESLDNRAPTLLIAPPSDANVFEQIHVDELAVQAQLGENYIEMPGAFHFTYLPECKPIGFYLLRIVEKDGQMLCQPEVGKTRAEFHAETSDLIINFLEAESILN